MSSFQKLARYFSLFSAVMMMCVISTESHAKFKFKNSNRVVTDAGVVVGQRTDYGSEFLGIPYAAAPEGDLRWQPTQPHAGWDGELVADSFGSSCPQTASPFGTASVDEDCLFLNVYRPYRAKFFKRKKLPVMVWIHGGAFTFGEGSTFDPARLVKEGVVVVNLNYRLGALGFMAHPALTANSASGTSGNFGLMDQQEALRWVQRNIAAFGGDPDNVTIFGESAGGLSVLSHVASPLSEGLFDKAIVQSGAYSLQQPTLEQYEGLGLAIAATIGCPDQSLECLMNAPVDTIIENADSGGVGFSPIVDGQVLPITTLNAFATGLFNQVPVMQGSNADEYTLFVALLNTLEGNPVTAENYVQTIVDFGFPEFAAQLVAAEYSLDQFPTPSEAFAAFTTDFVFSCNAHLSNQLLSQHVRTYSYEFADENAPFDTLPFVGFPYGATHTAEIQYLMDPMDGAPDFTREQAKLAKIMVEYWTNFAKFGTPNFSLFTYWPTFNAESQYTQSFVPPFPRITNDFAENHRCDFIGLLAGQ